MAAVMLSGMQAAAQENRVRDALRRSGGFLSLLRNEVVQHELDLTDPQKAAVQRISEDFRNRSGFDFGRLRDAPAAERERRFDQYRAWQAMHEPAAREALRGVLEDDQMQRLLQLFVQQRGVSAALDADVAQKLDLSAEQREGLTKKVEEAAERRRTVLEEAAGADGDDLGERLEAVQSDLQQELEGVLTEPQRAALKELGGEPLDLYGQGRSGQ